MTFCGETRRQTVGSQQCPSRYGGDSVTPHECSVCSTETTQFRFLTRYRCISATQSRKCQQIEGNALADGAGKQRERERERTSLLLSLHRMSCPGNVFARNGSEQIRLSANYKTKTMMELDRTWHFVFCGFAITTAWPYLLTQYIPTCPTAYSTLINMKSQYTIPDTHIVSACSVGRRRQFNVRDFCC